jgi:hypothetical protein
MGSMTGHPGGSPPPGQVNLPYQMVLPCRVWFVQFWATRVSVDGSPTGTLGGLKAKYSMAMTLLELAHVGVVVAAFAEPVARIAPAGSIAAATAIISGLRNMTLPSLALWRHPVRRVSFERLGYTTAGPARGKSMLDSQPSHSQCGADALNVSIMGRIGVAAISRR